MTERERSADRVGAPSGTRPTDDGQWRDERALPLAELSEAMAVYSGDGQVDDATGGDASAEEEFGASGAGTPPAVGGAGDPDPDSEAGRRMRPSPERGLNGPV